MAKTRYQQALDAHRKGDHDKAIALLEEEIDEKGNDPQALYNLGNVYADLEEYEAAVECYLLSIEENDRVAGVWYNLGNAYLEMREYEKAIGAYEKTTNIKDRYVEAWYNMGVAYTELEDDDKAIEMYQQSVKLDQNFHYGWYNLACIFGKKADLRQSLYCLKEAIMTMGDEIDYREMALEDPYFEPIRRHPEFLKLLHK